MMRIFVAVDILEASLLNAIAKLQSDLDIRASPVRKENMHFTLLFIGEMSDENVGKIKEALASISFKPIEVNFTYLGAFPSTTAPRVIWLGTDESSAKKLVELASQVEEKLGPLGIKSDKPFRPHLTIFRVRNKNHEISSKIERFKTVSLGKDIISEVKLKQSILTPNGPIYSDLEVVRAE